MGSLAKLGGNGVSTSLFLTSMEIPSSSKRLLHELEHIDINMYRFLY